MRTMKRLQTVRGNSAARVREVGGAGGGVSVSVAAATMSARVCSPACALEVEIVIPDFSVDGARPFGATDADETNQHRLHLRPRRELERHLLPVARPRGDGGGCRERRVR